MTELASPAPAQEQNAAAKFVESPTLKRVGVALIKRPPNLSVAPPPEEPATHLPPPPVLYPTVPYPVELAEMERCSDLPRTQLQILALRRLAHPVTGLWITSTEEVAERVGVDRSTAQKHLAALARTGFLHMTYLRSSTVRRAIWFGGFPEPGYRDKGWPPLRFDPVDSTSERTESAQPKTQRHPPLHTAPDSTRGSAKPKTGQTSEPPHTEDTRRTNNDIVNDRVFNNDDQRFRDNDNNSDGSFSVPRYAIGRGLIPVGQFQPRSYAEIRVKDFARRLGERHVNSFLELARRYGLERLEQACRTAQAKTHDSMYPLRENPGAYVRWLLQNGKC
jgi:hypothetical protein